MGIEEFLLSQASHQLKSTTLPVDNSEWVDALIEKLTERLGSVDPSIKIGSTIAIQAVIENRDRISALGADAFVLFIQQLATGRNNEAIDTFIQARGSVDELIASINADTLGLIAAKKKLDQWHRDAADLVVRIAVKGAQYLLPMLLAII